MIKLRPVRSWPIKKMPWQPSRPTSLTDFSLLVLKRVMPTLTADSVLPSDGLYSTLSTLLWRESGREGPRDDERDAEPGEIGLEGLWGDEIAAGLGDIGREGGASLRRPSFCRW